MFPSLILLTIVSSTKALIFPGHCPEVPPTHFLPGPQNEILFHSQIVFGVPFDRVNASPFFTAINVKGAHGFTLWTDVVIENDTVLMRLEHPNQPNKPVKSVYMYATNNKERGVVETQSAVYLEGDELVEGCTESFDQDVQLWMEKEVLIIWTCNNITETDSHDQAAVVVNRRPMEMSAIVSVKGDVVLWQYNDTLPLVKEVAGQYLPRILLSTIDWTTVETKQEVVPRNPFHCKSELRLSFYLCLVWLVGGSVVMLVVIKCLQPLCK